MRLVDEAEQNHRVRQPFQGLVVNIFVHWYNNGRHHQGIKNYPEVRYSGKRDDDWYINPSVIGAVGHLLRQSVVAGHRQSGQNPHVRFCPF